MLDQDTAGGAQDTIYLCNFRVSVDGEWLCLKELQDEVDFTMPDSMQRSPSPTLALSGTQCDLQQTHDDLPELCDILSSPTMHHESYLCLYLYFFAFSMVVHVSLR